MAEDKDVSMREVKRKSLLFDPLELPEPKSAGFRLMSTPLSRMTLFRFISRRVPRSAMHSNLRHRQLLIAPLGMVTRARVKMM